MTSTPANDCSSDEISEHVRIVKRALKLRNGLEGASKALTVVANQLLGNKADSSADKQVGLGQAHQALADFARTAESDVRNSIAIILIASSRRRT